MTRAGAVALGLIAGAVLGAVGMWVWQRASFQAAAGEALAADSVYATLPVPTPEEAADLAARIDAAGDTAAAAAADRADAAALTRSRLLRDALAAEVRLSLPPMAVPVFDAVEAAQDSALAAVTRRAERAEARADSLYALLLDTREAWELDRDARIQAEARAALWRAAAEARPAEVSLSIPEAGAAAVVLAGGGFVAGVISGLGSGGEGGG